MKGFIIIVSFIHKNNYVLPSHIYIIFEKSYKWVWNLGTLAQFQGSEISPGLLQDFTDGYIKFLRLPTIISSTAVPHQGGYHSAWS